MKRRSLAVLLVALMLVVLSSCVKETYDFKITANGGSVKREAVITKEVYDELVAMGEDVSALTEGGKLSFYTEDGTEYAKVTFSEKFDSLKELYTYMSNMGKSESGGTTDISDAFFARIDVSEEGNGDFLCITGVINNQSDISDYSSCDIILNFPGEITEYNIGEKIDDNTLSIDMVKLWESTSFKSFTIKAEAGSPFPWGVVIGMAAAIIILIPVGVLLKKKYFNR